jgi:hypothetical protein
LTEEEEKAQDTLELQILKNIDEAAKTAEVPASQALQMGIFIRNVVIFLAFYTALVALACTYAVYKVQNQADKNTRYLITSCVFGNEGRSLEKGLWDTVLLEDERLSELEGYKPSAEERAALKRISDAVTKAYPQLDCGKVDDGERVVITPTPQGGP